MYFVSCAFLRVLFGIYFRFRARGTENVPREGPFLLAVSHASFLDPLLVGCVTPRRLVFMARESLFRNPLFGGLIRLYNAVPVRREGFTRENLRVLLEQLAAGHPVLVFPEGTRSPDGELRPLRQGVVRIAQRTGAPVLPCRVVGSHLALGRGQRWPRPVRVRVYFGAPLEFAPDEDPERGLARLQQCMEALVPSNGRELAPAG